MKKETIILLAEDDEGHANLIRMHLKRSGINNEMIHFRNGEDILNFLLENHGEKGASYILLLDIRMPKVDGMEVLGRVKKDNIMKKFPVVMLTTTNEPGTVKKCYDMGCINYVVKPVGHKKFTETINQLAQFLMAMDIPA